MNPLRYPLNNIFRLYHRHSASLFDIRSFVLFLFLFVSFDSTSFAQGAGTYQVAVYGGNTNGYGDYQILTMSIANVGAPAVAGLRWASRFVGSGNGASEIDYAGGWYVGGSYWNDGASLNLYRTQDGINWQKVKVTDNLQLVDLAQSGSTWLALTNNGSVFRSVNSGGNWTLAGTVPGIGSNGTYVDNYNTSSIVYNDGTWVFITDKTAYRSSNNGTTWSSNATGSDMALYDLGVGNGVFVAVGEGGEIRTSSDAGQTWTKRTSGTDLTLNSAAFGNGRFVVVGSNGLVLTSTDNGTTWVSQASGSSSYLKSVSFGNNVFVRSDGHISSDGIAWSAPQGGWGSAEYDDGVVYGNAGWLMGGWTVYQSVAGYVPNTYNTISVSGTVGQPLSYQLSGALSFSQTPTQYAAINLPGELSINSTSGAISGVGASAGTYQVAVYGGNTNGYGDYQILTMSIANVGAPAVAGLRWASRFVGSGNGASEIDYAGGWYVGGSYWNDGASLNLYRTQDGINWQKVKVTDNLQLVDLAQSGSTWLALTNNGSVFRSVNSGGNWTLAGTVPGIGSNGTYVDNYNTSSIVYNDGTWVFITDKTAYRSSNNGTTWSSNATGSDMALYDLGVGNGVFVAVGEGGEIRTSSDAGQTWTKRTSGTDLTLNSAAFGNGRFVVVGSNGLVLTSTDNGTTWVSQASGSSSYLKSVSFGNNVFVRSDGHISSDGIAWSAPQGGWGSAEYDDGVVYGNAGWLMGGWTVYQSVAGYVPNTYNTISVSGTVGQPLSYQLSGALSFSQTPTQYAAINLPGGLSINSTSGDITGLVYKTIPSVISGGGFFFKSLAGGFIQSLPGSSYGFGGAAGSVDGNGGTALFNSPSGVAVDATGNIYVADSGNHAIRKITSSGNVTLFAGSFLGSGTADGWGEDARFNNPQGLAIDASGNLYVAEAGSHRIRKVSPFGQVTHYVGGIGVSGSVDGSPISARFNGPTDVAVDAAGNIYVADSGNHAIRKISTNGTVTTLAGTMGQVGNTNATGSAARFRTPQGIAVDGSGTVYVADTGNQVIRKVTSGGTVTTFSGAAFTGSASPLGGRASLTGSAHAAFLASVDPTSLPASLDGNATIARFSYPTDVTLDNAGNLYVTDSGTEKIRKIVLTGNVSTLGGSPDGFFYNPLAIAVGANGTLYVADAGNNRIATSFTPSPEISIEGLGGIDLSSAGEVVSLGNLLTGNASASYTFVIRNAGYADMSGLSLSKNGTHSDDFALGSLGVTTLSAGSSTAFTVTFTPSIGGIRSAQLLVASNDSDENPFVIHLAGFGLSASLDSDADGLSDAAEYRMSSLGFEWQLAQADMVSAFQAGANTGGLYNTSQIQAMNIGIPLISKNATSGQFEISVKLQKSTNLQTFQQFSLNATDTTIEPDGSLKIRFIAPDSAAFFRLQAK